MSNIKQFKNVELGKNVVIEDFVVIGQPPRGANDGDLKTVIGDNAIIRSHTVIYAGNTIGENFQTGHSVTIRENNKIGDNVSIGTGSVVEHQVEIKNNVRLHSQVFVCEFSVLNENAWIGPNAVLTNAKYPDYKGVKDNLEGITLGDSVKIGANATILPGLILGDRSLLGAGAVLTKNLPKNEIWAGNPAKKLKNSDEVGY